MQDLLQDTDAPAYQQLEKSLEFLDDEEDDQCISPTASNIPQVTSAKTSAFQTECTAK